MHEPSDWGIIPVYFIAHMFWVFFFPLQKWFMGEENNEIHF